MNTKEVGELRRRLRPGKNAISHIYGCYVGATKEIIAEVDQSTALLSEDDAEGCLSLPNEWGMVTRPMKVTVRAQNRKGKWFEMSGEELLARAFCHEIDHLHGTVFTDVAGRMLSREEIASYKLNQ